MYGFSFFFSDVRHAGLLRQTERARVESPLACWHSRRSHRDKKRGDAEPTVPGIATKADGSGHGGKCGGAYTNATTAGKTVPGTGEGGRDGEKKERGGGGIECGKDTVLNKNGWSTVTKKGQLDFSPLLILYYQFWQREAFPITADKRRGEVFWWTRIPSKFRKFFLIGVQFNEYYTAHPLSSPLISPAWQNVLQTDWGYDVTRASKSDFIRIESSDFTKIWQ